jgi:hypothetical protein
MGGYERAAEDVSEPSGPALRRHPDEVGFFWAPGNASGTVLRSEGELGLAFDSLVTSAESSPLETISASNRAEGGACLEMPLQGRDRVTLFFFVHGMLSRKHVAMQYPRDDDVVAFLSIKNDMTPALHSTQSNAKLFATSSQRGISS